MNDRSVRNANVASQNVWNDIGKGRTWNHSNESIAYTVVTKLWSFMGGSVIWNQSEWWWISSNSVAFKPREIVLPCFIKHIPRLKQINVQHIWKFQYALKTTLSGSLVVFKLQDELSCHRIWFKRRNLHFRICLKAQIWWTAWGTKRRQHSRKVYNRGLEAKKRTGYKLTRKVLKRIEFTQIGV